MSWKQYVNRWTISAVLLVFLTIGGITTSYRSGYTKGLREGQMKGLKNLQAEEDAEAGLVLRVAVKALNGAEKHPDCFSKSDIAFFKNLVKGNIDNVEKKLIARIRKEEAEERKIHSDRTKEDEKQRIEIVMNLVRQARELEKRFPD